MKHEIIVHVGVSQQWFCYDSDIDQCCSGVCHIPCIPSYAGCAASKLAMAKVMDYIQDEKQALRANNLLPDVVETGMTVKE